MLWPWGKSRLYQRFSALSWAELTCRHLPVQPSPCPARRGPDPRTWARGLREVRAGLTDSVDPARIWKRRLVCALRESLLRVTAAAALPAGPDAEQVREGQGPPAGTLGAAVTFSGLWLPWWGPSSRSLETSEWEWGVTSGEKRDQTDSPLGSHVEGQVDGGRGSVGVSHQAQ